MKYKNGPIRPLFVYFRSFSHDKYSTNTINDRSIDGVLGTRTRGSMVVGADKSTELWRYPPYLDSLLRVILPKIYTSSLDILLRILIKSRKVSDNFFVATSGWMFYAQEERNKKEEKYKELGEKILEKLN